MNLILELLSYFDLEEGWDGEYAPKPLTPSVISALCFAGKTWKYWSIMKPFIHSCGEIVIDVEEDVYLRFTIDQEILYSSPVGHGRVDFSSSKKQREIPEVIVKLLDEAYEKYGPQLVELMGN